MSPGFYLNPCCALFIFLFSRADAEQMVQAANRTWAIFICVGDYETNSLDIIGYKQDSAVAYTDVTMPSVTGMPYLESVCYVDKHPQVCMHTLFFVRGLTQYTTNTT